MPISKMNHPPVIVALDGATLNPGDLSWDKVAQMGDFKAYHYTQPQQIIERSKDADMLLVNKTPISRKVLSALPQLKFIGVTATGYNNVDLEAARENGITVSNAVGYSTDSVAQHVIALLLGLTNKVKEHDQSIRAGDWAAQPRFSYTLATIPELAGKAMGIYGFGRIGRRVGEIANVLGMKVIATHKHPERDARPWVRFVELSALFELSDVISLHAPLTDKNKEFVDLELLKKMKPSAYLINTGRGGLIREADLKIALEERLLAGAALDVLSTEPPDANHPLLKAPNCLLTPHMAWASRESRQRLMDITVENIKAFLKGEPENVVS